MVDNFSVMSLSHFVFLFPIIRSYQGDGEGACKFMFKVRNNIPQHGLSSQGQSQQGSDRAEQQNSLEVSHPSLRNKDTFSDSPDHQRMWTRDFSSVPGITNLKTSFYFFLGEDLVPKSFVPWHLYLRQRRECHDLLFPIASCHQKIKKRIYREAAWLRQIQGTNISLPWVLRQSSVKTFQKGKEQNWENKWRKEMLCKNCPAEAQNEK